MFLTLTLTSGVQGWDKILGDMFCLWKKVGDNVADPLSPTHESILRLVVAGMRRNWPHTIVTLRSQAPNFTQFLPKPAFSKLYCAVQSHGPYWRMTLAGCSLFRWQDQCRHSWHYRPAKHYWHNQQEMPCTVRTCSQTGCQRTCTPSPETSHCNESWPLLGYEMAKTPWTSSKDMDTADWNN